jgi:hypothetical protein
MARSSNSRESAPSRIRFVMVEAELGNGDIGQITQAIQNALRSPAASSVRRLSAITPANSASVESTETDVEVDEIETDDVEEGRSTAPKVRVNRKPPTAPDVVPMDMNSGVSLASFAEGKDAKSQHKKYLIASAWLKEHRSVDAVTAAHIYTCFRSMGWPTNIPDFWQPLRDLKAKKYFAKNDKNEYEINHIGLDFVKKLGGSNGIS